MRALRKFRGWKASGAFATFVIAVVGAVTGTISFFGQREVRVRLIPRAYEPVQRQGALRIGVVNGSYRGVSIVDGTVLFHGRAFAKIIKVLPSAGLLSDTSRSNADLLSAGQELPFAIAAGASLAGAVLWQVDDQSVYRTLKQATTAIADAKERIPYGIELPVAVPGGSAASKRKAFESVRAQQVRELADAKKIARRHLTLTVRAQFEPGGTRSIEVPIDVEPFATPSAGWRVRVVLEKGFITAITARQPRPPIPVIATLRLWSADSPSTVRRITRPVLPPPSPPTSEEARAISARFPLGHLRKGRYTWAVMVGQIVKQAGVLVTPCLQAKDGKIPRAVRTSQTINPDRCSPGFQEFLRSFGNG
jgi:hypothetical protein